MSPTPVSVVAEITAKPGSEESLKSLLMSILDEVRREEGCLQYDLHVSTSEPGSFLFYENWIDAESLKAHAASAHMKALSQKAADLLAGAPRILTYTRIG